MRQSLPETPQVTQKTAVCPAHKFHIREYCQKVFKACNVFVFFPVWDVGKTGELVVLLYTEIKLSGQQGFDTMALVKLVWGPCMFVTIMHLCQFVLSLLEFSVLAILSVTWPLWNPC